MGFFVLAFGVLRTLALFPLFPYLRVGYFWCGRLSRLFLAMDGRADNFFFSFYFLLSVFDCLDLFITVDVSFSPVLQIVLASDFDSKDMLLETSTLAFSTVNGFTRDVSNLEHMSVD